MIGEQHAAHHACGIEHLPNCYNPNLDLTACVCGDIWWRGHAGVWRSRALYEPAPSQPLPPTLAVGIGAVGLSEAPRVIVGWDRYFMHRLDCPDALETDADEGHTCLDVPGMTYQEAVSRD